MNQFKNLKIWQKSIDLTVKIYKLTNTFPSNEKFGLISQINRSAVSIASNIAEGAGRNNKAEFNNFLGIATGSAFELETQLIISTKIGYCPEDFFHELETEISELQKMIYNLQKTLKQNS